MKKKLLLLPLLGLVLSGCTFDDLKFWETKENTPQEEQKAGDDSSKESESEGEKTVRVTGVALSKKSLSLYEGGSEQLTYTISPSNATDKSVKWSTSNANIASVENGLIKGWNEGTATITVTTVDQSKTDSCTVSVSKQAVPVTPTINKSLVFNDKYNAEEDLDGKIVEIDTVTSVVFNKADGSTSPRCIKGPKTNKFEARAYGGNTIVVSSNDGDLKEIKFTFSTDNPGVNEITSNSGEFDVDTWTGSSKSVTFSIGGESGHRRISSISVTYEGQAPEPEGVVNLGTKTIAEVKQYIADHPFTLNAFGNGVNENRYVTIKGFALAKIDLVKSKKEYGLDVSLPAKVIMADATGYIGVATAISGDGTTLWGKIDDHTCEETSKYTVTGYLSMYLGHPELLVTAFEWNKDLDITWNASIISEATTTLTGFYEKAVNVNYNCAGHGYGEVITINNLKCYFIETDGSGKRYYNFTDGEKSIRVNAFNLGSVSEGSYYDVTGIISLKKLSPIIVAFDISPVNSPEPYEFDYKSVATPITIATLKTIKGSQDDTSTRYPDVVEAFGTIYKTEGYLTLVEENGKYYVGISDNYIERKNLISGKTNAMANYGISLIKNENFWNTTEEDLYKYNQAFDQYVLEDEKIEVYYVVRQLEYQNNKALWEILLLPDFLESDIFKVY